MPIKGVEPCYRGVLGTKLHDQNAVDVNRRSCKAVVGFDRAVVLDEISRPQEPAGAQSEGKQPATGGEAKDAPKGDQWSGDRSFRPRPP